MGPKRHFMAANPDVMMAGGFGNISPADDELNAIVEPLQAEAKAMAEAGGWAGEMPMWTLHSYTQQVVAGMNYNCKVQYDSGKFAHVRIYKPLPHTGLPASVKDVAMDKTESDDL